MELREELPGYASECDHSNRNVDAQESSITCSSLQHLGEEDHNATDDKPERRVSRTQRQSSKYNLDDADSEDDPGQEFVKLHHQISAREKLSRQDRLYEQGECVG